MDIKQFKKHMPVDVSDPGFSIPGARLRWISGRVRERSDTSGMWIPLRKSQLPKELVTHIENCYPNAFGDGDTIRRGSGELILAIADTQQVAKHQKHLQVLASEQAARAKLVPKAQEDGGKYKNDYAKVEEYEEGASTIPRNFLKKEQAE